MSEFTYTNEFLNPWLLALDVVLILHFVYSYYRYCFSLGYKIDFWHFSLLLGGVLPVLVNYIFAGAAENKQWVGSALGGIQSAIDKAFIIQAIGYICTYAGFYYYNVARLTHAGAGGIVESFVSRVAELFREFVNANELLYTHVVLTMAGAIALMVVAFGGGLDFNLRSVVFGDSALRPVYNFCFQAEGPILLGALWAKYLAEKRLVVLMWAVLFLALLLFSGARLPVIVPMGTLAAVYAISRPKRVKLLPVIGVTAALLTIALGIQVLRIQSDSRRSEGVNVIPELVYGNEYSDTRDFAWLLSGWDGQYLYGKSYLAGAFGFLPRAFFMTEFRETWSFTFYQGTITRLDPNKHAGLRPGRFGEIFLNFGYPAVIILGFLTGYLCRLIDYWIKARNSAGNHEIVADYSIAMCYTFLEPIYHSVASWTAYVLILVLFSVILHRTVRLAQPPGTSMPGLRRSWS